MILNSFFVHGALSHKCPLWLFLACMQRIMGGYTNSFCILFKMFLVYVLINVNVEEIGLQCFFSLWFIDILLFQVDEIMMTLKQAFSVAAVHQNSRTQAQQCESCPMQHLHKLCERIEGTATSAAF